MLKISKEIVKENGHFNRTKTVALAAIEELREAVADKKVLIEDRELSWLDTMESQIASVPPDEEEFTRQMVDENASEKFVPHKYDL